MVIPEIQEELKQLAKFARCQIPMQPHQQTYVADRVAFLAAELGRRKQHKTGNTTSRRMTTALKAEVVRLRNENPEWTQAQIAQKLGINSGRVSETLHGFRR